MAIHIEKTTTTRTKACSRGAFLETHATDDDDKATHAPIQNAHDHKPSVYTHIDLRSFFAFFPPYLAGIISCQQKKEIGPMKKQRHSL